VSRTSDLSASVNSSKTSGFRHRREDYGTEGIGRSVTLGTSTVGATGWAVPPAEDTKAYMEVRDEVHSQVRTITVGGLREQALGWLLIVVGTVLGGLGNILSARH
jgi:hypothetical protein